MAHISEIIDAYRNRGEVLPDNVKIVLDSTTAPTRERYNNEVIDALGGLENLPQWMEGAEVYKNPTLPSMKAFLDKLDIHDDKDKKNGKTAIEKVISGYSRNWKDWKETIEQDKRFGTKGWNFFKDLWKRAVYDQAELQQQKERKDIIDAQPGSSLVKMFRPRAYEAYVEGREPTWQEDVGDVAQSALYAVPYGKAVSAARMLPAWGRTALGLVTQAAAPLGVSGADAALGNKEFDWRDVGIGTLTNVGVNKVLFPQLSQGYNYLTGKIRGRNPGIADFLEGAKTSKEKAWDAIDDAKKKIDAHYHESDAQFYNKLAHGEKPARLSPEELEKYAEIASVGEVYNTQGKNIKDNVAEAIERANKNPVPQVKMLGKDTIWQVVENEPSRTSMTDFLNKVIFDNDGNRRKMAVNAITKNPSLAAIFYRTPPREALNALAAEGMKNWAVNKFGGDSEAKNPANLLNIDDVLEVNVEDLRKEQAAERKAKAANSQISKVISAKRAESSLTSEDERFLSDIAKDPSILQYGYEDSRLNDQFKMWLLKGGNDLLRGTDAFRPVWDVE